MDGETYSNDIKVKGFTVIDNIYTKEVLRAILKQIEQADTSNNTFRKTDDLFAIRQFLKEIPLLSHILFNDALKTIIQEIFGSDFFVVKSIYFDKPKCSNWFVGWHQDLTISVESKVEMPGYGPWTVKQNQFAVQPPINVLEDNFTIRIHLDDTDEGNGALKVISSSHLKGICRPEDIDWQTEQETVCPVNAGGIMIMRPLLMHASNRTTNAKPRKVIHIEFSKAVLPQGINWSEKQAI